MSRRHPGLLIGAASAVPVLVVVVLVMMMTGTLSGGLAQAQGAATPVTCTVPLPAPGDVSGPAMLTPKQSQNAATIIAVGKGLGVPARGWVVAIAAARQESGLMNLASTAVPESLNFPHDGTAAGDHDSVGMFQQRTAWGSVQARMNVAASARMFYTGGAAGQRGLLDVPGWQSMSVAEAAQAVQGSAFPSAYAQWESLATATVAALGNVDPSTASADCASVAATGEWVWPVNPPYTLTAGFGECGAHWADCHTGQDFAVPTGTPVHAIADGVVRFVGWGGPYGNLTKIEHADGVWSWYAHQSSQSVTVGTQVTAGQQIGLSGATGNVTGPHVHLEVRINDRPIDPLKFLQARVGKALPDSPPPTVPPATGGALPAFRVGTLNVLSDSHGRRTGYAPGAARMPGAVRALNGHGISVVGMQEVQAPQLAAFTRDASGWDIYAGSGPENFEAVAWRTDAFTAVAASRVPIPTTAGKMHGMPVVLLRSTRTGGEVFVVAVHNAAYGASRGGPAARAEAIAREVALVNGLSSSSGLPVFILGDFNDVQGPHCQLAPAAGMHSAAGATRGPGCHPPPGARIDALFGTAHTRFAHYGVDFGLKDHRITDHPFVYADAQ